MSKEINKGYPEISFVDLNIEEIGFVNIPRNRSLLTLYVKGWYNNRNKGWGSKGTSSYFFGSFNSPFIHIKDEWIFTYLWKPYYTATYETVYDSVKNVIEFPNWKNINYASGNSTTFSFSNEEIMEFKKTMMTKGFQQLLKLLRIIIISEILCVIDVPKSDKGFSEMIFVKTTKETEKDDFIKLQKKTRKIYK